MQSLPTEGELRMSDLRDVFGGSNPVRMGDYYANASSGLANGVAGLPSIGQPFGFNVLRGKSKGIASKAYPPVALGGGAYGGQTVSGQQYGNGVYFVARSSDNNDSEAAWSAFNKVTQDSTAGSYNYWTTGPFYNGVNYNGSNFTNVNGTNYAGEWVQLRLPQAITLTKVTLFTRPSNVNRAPRNWIIVGSNDGTSWTLLYTGVSNSWDTVNGNDGIISTTTAYSYYRLCINTIIGTETKCNVSEIIFYGY